MLKKQVSFAIFFVFLAVSLAFKISTEVKNGIPEGFKADPFLKIGKGLYYIEKKLKVNWFDANEQCHAMDSELITFETMDEWNTIVNYLKVNDLKDDYWTSGNDLAEQFRHVWFTTGKPIRLHDIWHSGEPNNFNDSNERCDEMSFKPVSSDTVGLNDHLCSNLRKFICEKRQAKTVSFVVY